MSARNSIRTNVTDFDSESLVRAIDTKLASEGYKSVLSSSEVMKLLGVSEATLWRLRQSARLVACQVSKGSKVLFLREDVAKFLADSRTQ